MGTRRFSQVDVFAEGGFHGNPVAVVHDADGIDTESMLQITEWTNLSETTFLLPPTDSAADYRVRIFCPGRELPFAGHPTIGSCRAWLQAGGTPRHDDRIVQECGAGLVTLRRDGERIAFAAPPLLRTGPVGAEVLARRLEWLGLTDDDVVDAVWADNGPNWMALLLKDADAVLKVALPATPGDADQDPDGFDVGLVGFHPPHRGVAIEVRSFFPDATGAIREDPVTGSLNASVAQWLLGSGRIATPYVAAQGTAMGRNGRVHVDQADGEIWIGGDAAVSITGSIHA